MKELQVSEVLTQALATNDALREKFASMSPSCQREYITWIEGAKREGTRVRRVQEALEMIAESQPRQTRSRRAKLAP